MRDHDTTGGAKDRLPINAGGSMFETQIDATTRQVRFKTCFHLIRDWSCDGSQCPCLASK